MMGLRRMRSCLPRLNDPAAVERIHALGAEPMPMTPSEFGAYIARDLAKWQKVVQGMNAK